ncbi:hypothetical protein HII36_52190 [Nonomuraea sp. NN258]|uniref:hypothetical protein n=1 Tax=Nonomuraea antri TaxID=2730852 RepID=UPI001567CD60|nr:hypothetical protein [Nonomuraea antri]NRQ40330.1 hypothetical protein [Nonomuraea antri]
MSRPSVLHTASVISAGLLLLVLGCSSEPEAPAMPLRTGSAASTPESTPTPVAPPVDNLIAADCVRKAVEPDGSPVSTSDRYQGTRCTDPLAIGKIVGIEAQDEITMRLGRKPRCADHTDFQIEEVTTIPEALTASERTIYCIRNLTGPHPGDPGNGGGVIRKGDCLTKGGKELACSTKKGRYWKVVFVREPPLDKGKDCPNRADDSLYDVYDAWSYIRSPDTEASHEFCVEKY